MASEGGPSQIEPPPARNSPRSTMSNPPGCKRALGRDWREFKTANCSTAIVRRWIGLIPESARTWRLQAESCNWGRLGHCTEARPMRQGLGCIAAARTDIRANQVSASKATKTIFEIKILIHIHRQAGLCRRVSPLCVSPRCSPTAVYTS
jgi:hypothetical protein